MEIASDWITGFCTKSKDKTSSGMLVVFPCSYIIVRNGEEIDITVKEIKYPDDTYWTLHYIGDYHPLLAKKLQGQFIDLHHIIPDETSLQNLLKAVEFLW